MKIFLVLLMLSLSLQAHSAAHAPKIRCDQLAGGQPSRSSLTEDQVQRVVDAVRFTFEHFRKDSRILTATWQKQNELHGLPSVGFCSAATNAIYHMLGGKSVGLTPMVATYFDPELLEVDPRSEGRASHWWLRDADGKYIDGTSDQYTHLGKMPPYHLGKGAGFNRPLTVPTIAGSILMEAAMVVLRERGYAPNGLPLAK